MRADIAERPVNFQRTCATLRKVASTSITGESKHVPDPETPASTSVSHTPRVKAPAPSSDPKESLSSATQAGQGSGGCL